jgi:hypothetical protein
VSSSPILFGTSLFDWKGAALIHNRRQSLTSASESINSLLTPSMGREIAEAPRPPHSKCTLQSPYGSTGAASTPRRAGRAETV